MIDVLAASAQAASSPGMRVRAGIPAPALREQGIEVERRPLFSDAEYSAFTRASLPRKGHLGLRARRRMIEAVDQSEATVAWILRRADIFPVRGIEDRLACGRRLVYDVDDAIWYEGGESRGHRLAALKGSGPKARWLASRADHVVAGNEILAEWLSRYSSKVAVIPSVVDSTDTPVRDHGDGELLTIGWIGSYTTSGYLNRVAGAIERAARELGGRRTSLLVVGGVAPHVRAVRSVQRPWSEDEEREALRSMDIGIMPLPDNRWTRGKCAYKALQYMAAGIPVVTDDVGISGRVVADAGVVASGEPEWIEALVELARDANLRRRLGDSGRRRVVDEYSVNRWAPTLARVLRGA